MNPSDKQAVLQSLNRLSDNHTRQKAWDELALRADRLDNHTVGAFLLCLHNTTAQHTLPCRRGAVRIEMSSSSGNAHEPPNAVPMARRAGPRSYHSRAPLPSGSKVSSYQWLPSPYQRATVPITH